MDETIAEFLHSWAFVRRMTYDFIDSVDDRHWLYTPHPGMAPLAKQFAT